MDYRKCLLFFWKITWLCRPGNLDKYRVGELRKYDIDKLWSMIFNIIVMGKGPDFVAQLEAVMGRFVGQIVCQSIIGHQLLKLNKDKAVLTANDCKTLTRNVLTAVSRFVTKEEARRLQAEMDKLLTTYFS
jgi:hypothetical protein